MHQRRIIITLLGGIAYLVAIMCALTMIVAAIGLLELNFATPRQWVDGMRDLLRDDGWLRFAAIFSSVLAGSQAIFLLPIFRFRPPRGARGTSLKVSIILAGFIAAGIVVAIMAALAELFAVLIAGEMNGSPWPNDSDMLDHAIVWLVLLVVFTGSWVSWSFILLVFTREMWADRLLGRIVHVLLAGTIIEFIVILPIDMMVRRRTDCYCATGTFLSICFAGTALLWLAGPGAWIAITSRRHRAVRERYCERCGHAKGPTPGEHCPECGCTWMS